MNQSRIVALIAGAFAAFCALQALQFAILAMLPSSPASFAPLMSPLFVRLLMVVLVLFFAFGGATSVFLAKRARVWERENMALRRARSREQETWGDQLLCWCAKWCFTELQAGREAHSTELRARISALEGRLPDRHRVALGHFLARLDSARAEGPDVTQAGAASSLDAGFLRIVQVGCAVLALASLFWGVLNALTQHYFREIPVLEAPVTGATMVAGVGVSWGFAAAWAWLARGLQGEIGRAAEGPDPASESPRPLLDQLRRWAAATTEGYDDRVLGAFATAVFGLLDPVDKRALLESLRASRRLEAPSPLLLSGGDLRGLDLQGFAGRGLVLKGVWLDRANLAEADFEGADLEGVHLRGADLRQCRLRGANLRGADLRDAECQLADFLEVDARGARLENANFWGCPVRPEA